MEQLNNLGNALIAAITSMPQLAIWALAIFYGFKVVVVGSIYGTIKYIANTIKEIMITRKLQEGKEDIRPWLNGICITSDSTVEELTTQLMRLRGRHRHYATSGHVWTSAEAAGHGYIHKSSVDWLREAIDAKIELDAREEANKSNKNAGTAAGLTIVNSSGQAGAR